MWRGIQSLLSEKRGWRSDFGRWCARSGGVPRGSYASWQLGQSLVLPGIWSSGPLVLFDVWR